MVLMVMLKMSSMMLTDMLLMALMVMLAMSSMMLTEMLLMVLMVMLAMSYAADGSDGYVGNELYDAD
jgi:hypothetical protein